MIREILNPDPLHRRTWIDWARGLPLVYQDSVVTRKRFWLVSMDEDFGAFHKMVMASSLLGEPNTRPQGFVWHTHDSGQILAEAQYPPKDQFVIPKTIRISRPPQIKIQCAENTSSLGARITDTDGNPLPGMFTHARIDINWATGAAPQVDLRMHEVMPEIDVCAEIRCIEIGGKKYRLVEDKTIDTRLDPPIDQGD